MRTSSVLIFVLWTLSVHAQSPAILTKFEQSHYLETVTYEECIAFSKQLADQSPLIHFQIIGKSPQKRDIPMLIIDKDGFIQPSDIRNAGRIVLMVQAGIHAGEPDGTDAMFLLLRDMVYEKKNLELIDAVSILFIPSFNVEGLSRWSRFNRINQNGPEEMGWRTNSINLNLNRDYMKAESPEMQAWLQIFNQFLPDFFIDCHTTDGADYQYDATYALETMGNMDEDITQWVTNVYEPFLLENMEQIKSPVFPYVTFKNWHDPRSGLIRSVGTPMISQGYTALQNRVGLLIETHMLKPYKPRVFATYNMILNTLKLLHTEAGKLQNLNAGADIKMMSRKFVPKTMAVKYKVDFTDTTKVEFLGKSYKTVKSDLTGGDWFQYSKTDTTFLLDLFEKSNPEKTVDLPLAYVIPVEWQAVQQIMLHHGFQNFITSKPYEIEVETYRFSKQVWSQNSFEGHQMLNSFDQKTIQAKIKLEPGAMIVPVSQRALKVLVYLLEPEADNSLVSWGYFNSVMERKEYAETYVMEKMAREMIQQNPGLLQEFEEWKNQNPEAAKNQWLQTTWFFERTPFRDQKKDVYPVGRIVDIQQLYKMGIH
jgi:hypothetical protein